MKFGSFRVRRRGPRSLLPAVHLARELRPPAPVAHDVVKLLEMLWARHGGRVWSVGELRALGYVRPDQCRALGYELSSAARSGGRVGRFTLCRVGLDRGGALYCLEVVTRGDSRAASAKNRRIPSARPR